MSDVSPNSRIVLEKRYLIKDTQGKVIETPEGLFRRVADFIAAGNVAYGSPPAEVSTLADDFYQLLSQGLFLPNSPTLMNAGRPLGQLSACFVLPIEDSIASIFETLKHTALIHQSGGGTGFSFSQIRPKQDWVNSSQGAASGPVSFLEVYNAATEAIKQGGTRRGANMGILRIDHPDIEEFIHCKGNLSRITNFNLSVGITDAFMEAVAANAPFDLIHPNTGHTTQTINARALFEEIIQNAWATGEPGLIFVDAINRDNPTPTLGAIEATNPCGEVPLLAYEACNLGSISLGKMLNAQGQLDWDQLAHTVSLAIHFLDNVITQNKFPIPEIESMVLGNRKVGLGVMGWADLLLALGIPYDTEEALALGQAVAAWIDYHAKQASVMLAKMRGPFPNFPVSRYAQENWLSNKHAQHITERITPNSWRDLDEQIHAHGLRNATTTCIAPTGTISIIANASGGIEPLFSVVFMRNIMEGTRLLEVHPLFEHYARQERFYSQALLETIAKIGSLQGISEIPEQWRRLFVTSYDITPEWHVRMQAAFQQFSDNGVSKTINLPQHAPPEAIANTYQMAYQLGLKGITVYRDQSRSDQPMSRVTETAPTCPDCGHRLQASPGCMLCPACAYSVCL